MTRGAGVGAIMAVLGGLLVLPVSAQQEAHQKTMPTSGLRAELVREIDGLEKKFLGLADAMNGKYAWRPGQGVRSVSEVFMHVAGANLLLPSMAGIHPPEGTKGGSQEEMAATASELEKITDPVKLKETLKHSMMHARHAIASIPDSELESPIKLFGQDANKRQLLTLLVTHMHEHLGQSIAYARMNGVVPPWSGGN